MQADIRMATAKEFTKNPSKYLFDTKAEAEAAASDTVKAGTWIDSWGLKALAQSTQTTIVVLSYSAAATKWTIYILELEPWKLTGKKGRQQDLVWLRHTLLKPKHPLTNTEVSDVLGKDYCNALRFDDIDRRKIPLQGAGHICGKTPGHIVGRGSQQHLRRPSSWRRRTPR